MPMYSIVIYVCVLEFVWLDGHEYASCSCIRSVVVAAIPRSREILVAARVVALTRFAGTTKNLVGFFGEDERQGTDARRIVNGLSLKILPMMNDVCSRKKNRRTL